MNELIEKAWKTLSKLPQRPKIAMAVVITIILLSLLNGALGNKVSWRNRYYSTKPEKQQTLSEISSEALKDVKKKGKVSKDFQLDLEIFS